MENKELTLRNLVKNVYGHSVEVRALAYSISTYESNEKRVEKSAEDFTGMRGELEKTKINLSDTIDDLHHIRDEIVISKGEKTEIFPKKCDDDQNPRPSIRQAVLMEKIKDMASSVMSLTYEILNEITGECESPEPNNNELAGLNNLMIISERCVNTARKNLESINNELKE